MRESPLKAKKPEKILLSKRNAVPSGKNAFVFIIPSYNNAKYCERNLRSVFDQTYSNYRVIYVDDGSSDGTADLVEEWVEKAGMGSKFTLIRNPENLGALANLYTAIQLCKDDEIAIILDGDDWLAHDHVLYWLAAYYDDPNVWMTYGSTCEYPSYNRHEVHHGFSKKVHKKHNYRQVTQKKFLIAPLRTAYAGLLKRVKKQDLQREGKFLPATYDQALMIPAIEMAKEHAHFIQDVLYIYNRETPLSDDKVRLNVQKECKQYVLNLPPYDPIDDWHQTDTR